MLGFIIFFHSELMDIDQVGRRILPGSMEDFQHQVYRICDFGLYEGKGKGKRPFPVARDKQCLLSAYRRQETYSQALFEKALKHSTEPAGISSVQLFHSFYYGRCKSPVIIVNMVK
jgi:hypothetical protein